MVKSTLFFYSLPLLAQAQYLQNRGSYHGSRTRSRTFQSYEPQAGSSSEADDEVILDRALVEDLYRRVDGAKKEVDPAAQQQHPAAPASQPKAPASLNRGKGTPAAAAVDKAVADKGLKIRPPPAKGKLEKIENSQVSTFHKITHPAETLAGGERQYYKQKLEHEFGTKLKKNYETQRDKEIVDKKERTKNYEAQKADGRKLFNEEITTAGSVLQVAGEGVNLAKSVIRPFSRRDLMDELEEMIFARELYLLDEEDELFSW